ncbi:putative bactericidal permeability-increasing protein [Apostichopus japonicus]|uniref:Putative bactericidal permeability-increasing protein n=1 Tax=Stichopus japonicus TaxID=307972 RepID=A0A2G8JTC4_STIJA|nr:putative bactericidal permeability-increasing protein [Apostichopus japonicus]
MYHIFIVIILFLGSSLAVKTGFQARITPTGLRFLSDVGVRKLKEEISKATIPDQSGSADVVIGTIRYSLTNIHVTRFDIPSASISTVTDVGLKVSASGLSISLHGDWRYKLDSFIPVSDSGSFDVWISDVTLYVTIEIGVDATGRPTVYSSSNDCAFYAGRVDITLHGGASWLYNLFDSEIADKIQDTLNHQTSFWFTFSFVIFGIYFPTVVASITDKAEIDYSLVTSPIFDVTLTTSHKGEIYQKGNHTEAPYEIPTIPSDPDQSKMVFMWMTDYVANSAGYVLQNTGFFQYNVTQDKVPPSSKISLNTSEFAVEFLIPQLAKLYPDMMMQLNLNTTQPPLVSITPDKVGATVTGDVAAYVMQPNNTLAYLFTLEASVHALDFENNGLFWKNAEFDNQHINTDVGRENGNRVGVEGLEVGPYLVLIDIKIDKLRLKFQLACKMFIIPKINDMGAAGVPVPSFDKYSLQNPELTQGKGFVKIGTDMVYDPLWETRAKSRRQQQKDV